MLIGIGLLTSIACTQHESYGRWPPENVDWRTIGTDDLIRLFARDDPPTERRVIGRLDDRVIDATVLELEHRMGKAGFVALSGQQQNALLMALRKHIASEFRNGKFGADEPLWDFAAKYDGEWLSDMILKRIELVPGGPASAADYLVKAGHEADVYPLVAKQLRSIDEFRVGCALAVIGKYQLKRAADEVYAKTRALSWIVRLQALLTLYELDDPRVNEALQDHLEDIRRTSIGVRVLWLPTAVRDTIAAEDIRVPLLKALAERKVLGAEDTLEAVFCARGGGVTSREVAGVGLAGVNRSRGIAATRLMLRDNDRESLCIAANVAGESGMVEVLDVLEGVASRSSYQECKDAANRAIQQLTQGWPNRR